MFIRRKVYSTFEDENGEERLFSTTEFIDEDQYLNEALYSVYSDEEPEQKEYASIRKLMKSANRLTKIAKKIDTTKSSKILDKLYKAEDKIGSISGRMKRSGATGFLNDKSKAKAIEKMSKRLSGNKILFGNTKESKQNLQKKIFEDMKEGARSLVKGGGHL